MSNAPVSHKPKRKKILFIEGFQLRYSLLVAGSLAVLLIFAGFHAIFVASTALPPEVFATFKPVLQNSTWRLFGVGVMYIGVVTMAAVLLSHRVVGPAQRIERQLNEMAELEKLPEVLHVRDGDEFEGLVGAINKLVNKVRGAGGV